LKLFQRLLNHFGNLHVDVCEFDIDDEIFVALFLRICRILRFRIGLKYFEIETKKYKK
jgi:hypothetical protein